MTLPVLQHARLRRLRGRSPARGRRGSLTRDGARSALGRDRESPETARARPPRLAGRGGRGPARPGRAASRGRGTAPRHTRRAARICAPPGTGPDSRTGAVRDRTSGRLDHPATGEFRVGLVKDFELSLSGGGAAAATSISFSY